MLGCGVVFDVVVVRVDVEVVVFKLLVVLDVVVDGDFGCVC